MVEEAIEDIIILVQKMSFQKSLDYQNSFTDGIVDGEWLSVTHDNKLKRTAVYFFLVF